MIIYSQCQHSNNSSICTVTIATEYDYVVLQFLAMKICRVSFYCYKT